MSPDLGLTSYATGRLSSPPPASEVRTCKTELLTSLPHVDLLQWGCLTTYLSRGPASPPTARLSQVVLLLPLRWLVCPLPGPTPSALTSSLLSCTRSWPPEVHSSTQQPHIVFPAQI